MEPQAAEREVPVEDGHAEQEAGEESNRRGTAAVEEVAPLEMFPQNVFVSREAMSDMGASYMPIPGWR